MRLKGNGDNLEYKEGVTVYYNKWDASPLYAELGVVTSVTENGIVVKLLVDSTYVTAQEFELEPSEGGANCD